MAKLVILNYATGIVNFCNIDGKLQSEDVEDFITEDLGIKLGNISWMVTNEEYPIEHLDY